MPPGDQRRGAAPQRLEPVCNPVSLRETSAGIFGVLSSVRKAAPTRFCRSAPCPSAVAPVPRRRPPATGIASR